MSADQRKQFIEVADLIYKDVPVLSKGLAPELSRAAKASAAMNKTLAAGRDRSKLPKVKSEFDKTLNAHAAVFATIQGLVASAQQQLGDPTVDPKIPVITGDKAAEKRDVLAFSQALVHFFHGSALIGMQAELGSYIGLCEAFLGHKIGSHRWRKRVAPVLKEAALIAAGKIPGSEVIEIIPVIAEAIKAARESTERVDVENAIRLAEGRDRQVRLDDALDTARESAEHVAAMTAISVDGVVSERSAFAELLKTLSLTAPASPTRRPNWFRRTINHFRRSK